MGLARFNTNILGITQERKASNRLADRQTGDKEVSRQKNALVIRTVYSDSPVKNPFLLPASNYQQ